MQNFIHVDDQSKETALNAVVAEMNARAKYTANSATADATAAAASVSGAAMCNLRMTGALGAGRALTLPTVSALLAADTTLQIGESYILRVLNASSGAFAWTVTTAAGWTLNGTMTVAQNTWRDFLVSYDSAGAMSLTNLGGGNVP